MRRILDLFCAAGGSAMGYYRAGFEVIGVDIEPQPHFPFDFIEGDAMAFLEDWEAQQGWWQFDAIHASPPCQAFTLMRQCSEQTKTTDYPDLIAPVRDLLEQTGLPWVIENVPGAPLLNPILLCGSQFDPPLDVKRHRLFEANWPLQDHPWPCRHKLWAPRFPNNRSDRRLRNTMARVVIVAGNDSRGPEGTQVWRDAMRIPWMTRDELREAIPPVYTEFIGQQLLDYIGRAAA